MILLLREMHWTPVWEGCNLRLCNSLHKSMGVICNGGKESKFFWSCICDLCDLSLWFFFKHIASCHWAQVSCLYKQVRLDVSLGSSMLGVGFLRVAWGNSSSKFLGNSSGRLGDGELSWNGCQLQLGKAVWCGCFHGSGRHPAQDLPVSHWSGGEELGLDLGTQACRH